ncbi:TetR/AcrR family transcriptional regulator [Kitasatospora sp. MBT63]|uniref:TetR/AcrR family transcriptional regulator n=1 Tax=Kitasatospora sp. MBT63 TaxID=1444768 RepID=UPI000A528479|nr:TetR/AcrR family transcriptional regulator [Kitasatospora sp. MBT63]
MSRAYHHGNLREALVAGGVDLARTGGPAAVVLRAVSRQAGVSHNAAYRHFANREDLLAAVAGRCMEQLGRLMISRSGAVDLADQGQADEVQADEVQADEVRAAWARLSAIGEAYVDFAIAEPGWFRTAFCGAVAPPRKEAVGGGPGADPFAILSSHLDDLVRCGAVPAGRRPGAEYAAWSAVHGLSDLLVEGPLRGLPDAEVRVALSAVLSAVARGL